MSVEQAICTLKKLCFAEYSNKIICYDNVDDKNHIYTDLHCN